MLDEPVESRHLRDLGGHPLCRSTVGGFVGTERVFADAGFTEVSRPTLRRAVMRIDL